jgi:hypothetical protein
LAEWFCFLSFTSDKTDVGSRHYSFTKTLGRLTLREIIDTFAMISASTTKNMVYLKNRYVSGQTGALFDQSTTSLLLSTLRPVAPLRDEVQQPLYRELRFDDPVCFPLKDFTPKTSFAVTPSTKIPVLGSRDLVETKLLPTDKSGTEHVSFFQIYYSTTPAVLSLFLASACVNFTDNQTHELCGIYYRHITPKVNQRMTEQWRVMREKRHMDGLGKRPPSILENWTAEASLRGQHSTSVGYCAMPYVLEHNEDDEECAHGVYDVLEGSQTHGFVEEASKIKAKTICPDDARLLLSILEVSLSFDNAVALFLNNVTKCHVFLGRDRL